MKFILKAKKICMTKKDVVKEHKKLVRVLKEKKPKDLDDEAEEQEKELKEYMSKANVYGYTGPMNAPDIIMESWKTYFDEGGSLNRPPWMENNRLKEIQRDFSRLAKYHAKI